VKKNILIIGKSSIALRHYYILKKINKNFFFYFLDSSKFIWVRKNKKFFKLKDNVIFDKYFLVVICTPSNLHINYINKFVTKTNYIFVEKPITNNLHKFLNFKKKISKIKNFPKLAIGYNLRFTNSLIKFKKILNKESLGKLIYISARVGISLDQWRSKKMKLAANKKKTGGGVILELSHELDYLNWLFGPLSYGYSVVNKIKKFNFDVEENFFSLIFSKNKVPINLVVDMIRANKIRTCEAVFSKGLVTINLLNGTIKFLNKFNKKNYKFVNDINNSYKKMWSNFFNKKYYLSKTMKETHNLLDIINKIKKNN
jgi:predicted dehydrogenase